MIVTISKQLIDVLKRLQDKLSALVYCQRFRTPYIFDALYVLKSDQNFEVFSIGKDFISSKKQKDQKILKQYKAVHQCLELQLKSLDFILRKESQVSASSDKSRPKRPRKRARNAMKKASLNLSQ